MTLTTKAIEAAKPKDKPYKLADSSGLYLFVATTGTRSWRANFIRDGKQATRTYGRWPAMSLAEARQAHHGHREAPKEKKMPTFAEVAEAWLKIKLPSLSNSKHQGQVENTLKRFAFPQLSCRTTSRSLCASSSGR